MNKHTPGPWSIDKTILTAINAGDKHVAMVNYYNSPTDTTRVAGEEHDANARLIAAAPTILEALRAIDGLVDRYLEHGSDQTAIVAQIVDATTAAIAIATGGRMDE